MGSKNKAFVESTAANHILDVLICSSKDTTSGLAAAARVSIEFSITVILHNPSVFCTGQIEELREM